MTPIKHLLFGESGEDEPGVPEHEDPVERLHQLRRGTEAAVASLPDEHQALGRRALEAVRSLETSVARDGERAPGAASRASSRVARLHFDLVRLAVGEEAPELDLDEAIRGLESADRGPVTDS
ncbi:MAG: hypothetical protein Q8W51_09355 [Candidatus Palauibacterales bacterium]|nr:hypothetical protein [Candidatus Palauibacterales bacterium]MDP2583354.1 hypothetical protein [Candidatus Palauibacterales bacterium]